MASIQVFTAISGILSLTESKELIRTSDIFIRATMASFGLTLLQG